MEFQTAMKRWIACCLCIRCARTGNRCPAFWPLTRTRCCSTCPTLRRKNKLDVHTFPPSRGTSFLPPDCGSRYAISREPGGKGSFQAVKLQRPARTTVCSHSTGDIAAISSIEFKHDIDDTQNECLYSCGQAWSRAKTNIRPHVLAGQL
jgi:hypothetical protein